MRKNEKLKSLRKENGYTQKQFAELLDVQQPFIVAIEKGVSVLPKEKAQIIADKFKVDLKWLLNDDKNEITPIPTDAYMMVEYVDLAASAGALGLTDVELLPETKLRLVPKEFDRGNYLVVRVNGDSMVDGTDISIPDGTEILVKEYTLEPGEKLPIRGNLFVICSSEGNVFKQITEHNIEEGFIRCHSYNKRYDDYIIPLREIHQIFVYKKIVSYRPSIPEIK